MAESKLARRRRTEGTGHRNVSDRPRRDLRQQALIFCTAALVFLIAGYVVILSYFGHPPSPGVELRLDEFLVHVEEGRVASATILASDDRIVGTWDEGSYWVDFAGDHESLFARLTGALESAGVPTRVEREPVEEALVDPLSIVVPVLILMDGILIVSLLTRGGEWRGFGRAGAKRAGNGASNVGFADLAGVDEAVEELAEVGDYLADPGRFAAMGAAVPKGVLLAGPPGCGKTRLAQALANESDASFFSISGSDFVEMFVGVGAARIRDLFATAKAAAPAIVFIDELDAVGRGRVAGPTGGSDEREATLNQLLVEMDGFDSGTGVVVVAATNRPDILDPALLRPGRFDRRITIDPPDQAGREGVLAIHARHKPLSADVDLGAVARRTVGFSGADLANVVNEAALLATRRGSPAIERAHLSEAIERVVAGPERRTRVLSPDDRRRIAYHEAGHAVCAAALPAADPVGKVSVVARGHGGGFTWYLPEADRVLATRSQLRDRMAALLAGRAAEELVLGEPSTGANDDLARATGLARRMVWEWGMSERIGPVSMRPFVHGTGADAADGPCSPRMADDMDAEVQAVLREAQGRARAALEDNHAALAALAGELVVAESVEGEDLERILGQVRVAEERVGRPPLPGPARSAAAVRAAVVGAGRGRGVLAERLAGFSELESLGPRS